MKAREVMTRNVTCITPDYSAREAYQAMMALQVRHLPVVVDGKLCGIVSDRDLLPLIRKSPDGTIAVTAHSVEEVMTESPITAEPSTTVARMAEQMLAYRIDALPIIKNDRLVGVVTSTDLLYLLTIGEPSVEDRPPPFEYRLTTPTRGAFLAAANA